MVDPKIRNPWDSGGVKDPRDPDLADPFGGDIGSVKAEKPKPEPKPKPVKRTAKAAPVKRTRRPRA